MVQEQCSTAIAEAQEVLQRYGTDPQVVQVCHALIALAEERLQGVLHTIW